MLSRDLRQILPPKAIFCSSKSANVVKKFATNHEIRQFRQISSKINIFVTTTVFVISLVFRQKQSFGAYL